MCADFAVVPLTEALIPQSANVSLVCQKGWSERSIRDLMNKEHCINLCALSPQGIVMGFINIEQILDEATIYNVAVLPEYRRKGVAKALLANAISKLPPNCSVIMLEVRASNFPAIILYKSFEFKEVGRRKRYYRSYTDGQPDEDALLMNAYFK